MTPYRFYTFVSLSLGALVLLVFIAVLLAAHAGASRAIEQQTEANAIQREFGQSQVAPGSRL